VNPVRFDFYSIMKHCFFHFKLWQVLGEDLEISFAKKLFCFV